MSKPTLDTHMVQLYDVAVLASIRMDLAKQLCDRSIKKGWIVCNIKWRELGPRDSNNRL